MKRILLRVSPCIALLSCSSNTMTSADGGGSGAGGGGDDVSSMPDRAEAGSDGSRQAQDAAVSQGGDDVAVQDVAAGDLGTTMPIYVTFYGWVDNSPPGNAIAYPGLHTVAGGTGTYVDPITFATDRTEFPRGTRLYVPFIEKYVVMEDSCGACTTDWTTLHKWHIDIWMNSNGSENANALITCENLWTQDPASVELNPPPTRAVTTAPLFVPASNTCRLTP